MSRYFGFGFVGGFLFALVVVAFGIVRISNVSPAPRHPTPVPTATPFVCPEIPPPCPMIIFRSVPDLSRILENLDIARAEFELGRDGLEEILTSTDGEYDWNLVAMIAWIDSATHYLELAGEELFWIEQAGEYRCP